MSLPVIPIAAGLGLLALLLSKGGKGGSSQSSEGGEDLPDGTLPGGEGSGGQGGTPELSGGLVQLTPILENFQLCLGREMSRQSAEGTAHERFQIPEDVEVVPLLEGVITEGADFQGTASDTLHLQYNYPILPGGAASLSLMDGGKARLKKASDADGSACPPYPSARILAEESPYSLIFATISEGGTVFSTVAQTASAIELEDPLIRAVAVVPARNHGVVMAERAQLPLKVEMKPFVAIAPGVNVGYQQGFIDSVPSDSSVAKDVRQHGASATWGYSMRMFWSSLGPQLDIPMGSGGNEWLGEFFGTYFAQPGAQYPNEPMYGQTVVCAVNRKFNIAKMVIFAGVTEAVEDGMVTILPMTTDNGEVAQIVSDLAEWAVTYEPAPPSLTDPGDFEPQPPASPFDIE